MLSAFILQLLLSITQVKNKTEDTAFRKDSSTEGKLPS